jgi:hypothetical protein
MVVSSVSSRFMFHSFCSDKWLDHGDQFEFLQPAVRLTMANPHLYWMRSSRRDFLSFCSARKTANSIVFCRQEGTDIAEVHPGRATALNAKKACHAGLWQLGVAVKCGRTVESGGAFFLIAVRREQCVEPYIMGTGDLLMSPTTSRW